MTATYRDAVAEPMSAKCVLLVAEADTSPPLRAALAALDFDVRTARPSAAAAALQATRFDVVTVAPFADGASARFVAHLLQTLKGECPPVVAALGRRDSALRDQCLIAGAADVSIDGQPEDVAARVDLVVNGWLRAGLRRPLPVTIRAQRGRQTVELAVTDVDPSGIGLADAAGLVTGELLRFTLPLPGAELVVWARVADAEGAPGVRFLGLSSEERARLLAALQAHAKAAPAAVIAGLQPAPVDTAPEPSAPTLPLTTPAPGQAPVPAASRPAGPAGTDTLPPLAKAALRPPARSGDTLPPIGAAATPVRTPTLPPNLRPLASATAGDTLPPIGAAATPVRTPTLPPTPGPIATGTADAPTPVEAAAAPAPTEKLGAIGIGAAIGELLGDVPAPTPAPASEGDVLAALLDSALEHRWPMETFEPASTLNSLTMAISLGLVADERGAPSGDLVIEFVRTLSPLERRFFDPEPPTEIPDHDLARRTLAHRLRLLAVQRDGEVRSKGEPKVVVDEQALAALSQQTDQLLGELQKIVDGFVAAGQPQRIKDVNQFKIAMTRALGDVRAVASKVKGELVQAGSAVLLDSDEETQSPARWAREGAKEPEKKVEAKPTFQGFEETLEVRARRRMVWSVAFIVVGAAIAVLTWPPAPKPMPLDRLGNPPGISSVIVQDKGTKARYVATPSWRPDEAQLRVMRVNATRAGIEALVILDDAGRLLAFSARADSPIRALNQKK